MCICACKQRMPVHKHTFLLACEIHLTYIVISEFPASVGADSLLEIWRAEPWNWGLNHTIHVVFIREYGVEPCLIVSIRMNVYVTLQWCPILSRKHLISSFHDERRVNKFQGTAFMYVFWQHPLQGWMQTLYKRYQPIRDGNSSRWMKTLMGQESRKEALYDQWILENQAIRDSGLRLVVAHWYCRSVKEQNVASV